MVPSADRPLCKVAFQAVSLTERTEFKLIPTCSYGGSQSLFIEVSNSTMTVRVAGEPVVVALNTPRYGPEELRGISNPTGARKKAKPSPYDRFPSVSMMNCKHFEDSSTKKDVGSSLGLCGEVLYLLNLYLKNPTEKLMLISVKFWKLSQYDVMLVRVFMMLSGCLYEFKVHLEGLRVFIT
ncbi:hypothetical protein OSB04_030269 [Centaurea solstitialis]|uniref:Uncharacterized protein n=1 Tax=Centaurea solstitialis TaxID=347529 RepID=A0AA38SJJ0_9ASTR|nr:hypothetical protein OSB04_030269 [Centaurea solstitialis]